MAKELLMAQFANATEDGIAVASGALPVQMQHSDGTGAPLLKRNGFGSDIIRFAAGEGVKSHTHEGDHMLFVIKGEGVVEYDGVDHPLKPGVCYFVDGNVPHAIRAETELTLIAVGNDHRPLDSEARLTPIEQ